ncbi:MAG: glycosyltransferase [Pseudomonadota bacterium]
MSTRRHIVFVQSSDFWGDTMRLAQTGEQNFRAQRYSMDFVTDLAAGGDKITVIAINRDEAFRRTTPAGIDVVFLRRPADRRESLTQVTDALAALPERPTHVILRIAHVSALDWCCRNGVRVHANLADSFTPRAGLRGWMDRLRFRRLARLINGPRIDFCSNHNIAASQDLARIGVSKTKIIPWDWPPEPKPEAFAPRTLSDKPVHDLLFVGSVKEAKGVGDLIRAFAASGALRTRCRLTVVGRGDVAGMTRLARDLDVADRVTFRGAIPFDEVVPTMRAHDLVLVYSRHEYTEGLPGVIYEGLTAKTPIVISDHPMFVKYFSDAQEVAMAPAGAPAAMAARILDLLDDPALYAALSDRSEDVFYRIQHPLAWAEVIGRWLRNSEEDRAWMAENALPKWETRAQSPASGRGPGSTTGT